MTICGANIKAFLFFCVEGMGCLFGCFRVKDSDRQQPQFHPISDVISSKTREALVPKNQFLPFLQCQEQISSCEDVACADVRSRQNDVGGDFHVNELKEEANFLKSWGTLMETPVEIRKSSERVEDLLHDGDDVSSKFHSWLHCSCKKKLHLEEQSDAVPITLDGHENIPVHQISSPTEPRMGSFLLAGQEETEGICHGSCKSSGFENPEIATSDHPVAVSQYRNKSVRFECDTLGNSEMEILKHDVHRSKKSDSPCIDETNIQLVGSRCSPCPTPLKLSEEMQTPGTIYPAKLAEAAIGKKAHIRSQYVYPVLNSVDNLLQLNALKDSNA